MCTGNALGCSSVLTNTGAVGQITREKPIRVFFCIQTQKFFNAIGVTWQGRGDFETFSLHFLTWQHLHDLFLRSRDPWYFRSPCSQYYRFRGVNSINSGWEVFSLSEQTIFWGTHAEMSSVNVTSFSRWCTVLIQVCRMTSVISVFHAIALPLVVSTLSG